MYRVFIVDDEETVRNYLRSKIHWKENGFSFAGEAQDAEQALSMLQDMRPDILITGSSLPHLDGFLLSENAKKLLPWIKIIILSTHDEFCYTKKAISIGVADYILKPFTLKEITASLKKVASAIEQERKKATYHDSAAKNDTSQLLERTRFLTSLVYGIPTDAAATAKRFSLILKSPFYAVCVSEITSSLQDKTALLATRQQALLLESPQRHCIVFPLSPTTFATLIFGLTQTGCEEHAFSFAAFSQHELSKDGITLVTAIGAVVDTTEGLALSFTTASDIIKQSHFSGKNRIIAYSDLEKATDTSIVLQVNDPLVERLHYANETEIDSIIGEYIALLGENSAHFSVIASYLLVDVIVAVSKEIESLGGDIKCVMPQILTHNFVEHAVQSESVFVSETRNLLTRLLQYRSEKRCGHTENVILKAKRYIEQNYKNPDICLRTVAEEVALSPNHFSTVFSQDCGITFIEYLTHVRIEHAKKLLTTTALKSADIAYEIGFSDPHYFSFIFKKTEGKSPREFRHASQLSVSPTLHDSGHGL